MTPSQSGNQSSDTAAPVSHSAVLIAASGSRRIVTPFDSTPDTYTLDEVVYQYVSTSDGVAFYSERVTIRPFIPLAWCGRCRSYQPVTGYHRCACNESNDAWDAGSYEGTPV